MKNMAKLRSRIATSKAKEATKIEKHSIKKRVTKNSTQKAIIQTFEANDEDIKTVHPYPRTQKERNGFINSKTGRKVTAFQFQVYDLIEQIPKGQVTSYKILSDALKSSPRAVGQALRLNPFCPLPIPCHRVIASDYTLGGFGGGFGDHQLTANKKAKLEAEGCVFGDHYLYKNDANGLRTFFSDFVTNKIK
ncbi:6-O-methylguanine DNA methyltransferase [Cokeromyces recurvatus]|uniref:6-O-methylguanine DNA methyltransferase n=1 Tax=Cokeromyces recurvatus TaxID=90255 RepID=UPI002220C3B0|nr:6-O-methylguanine DNA methyltransferase [Cokeromyces recurvatus]KAI7901370.1 6-O-methylguanine DNA methyltransferase [Cokeromyces recurvatus]